MSNIINKVKNTFSSSPPDQDKGKGKDFTIQPHPAKTNNPADLQQPGQGGLGYSELQQTTNAKQPYVPSPDIQAAMEQPKSREELRARAAELNNN